MKLVLGITMGDAAGIGAEVIVKVLGEPRIYDLANPIIVGDKKIIQRALEIVKSDLQIRTVAEVDNLRSEFGYIDVIDLDNLPVDLPFAQVDGRAGKAAYEYIESAVKLALKNKIHAIVTVPLNKEALHAGGKNFPGHTAILAYLSQTEDFSMMLISETLNVIHVTTHVSMHQACDLIKKERVLTVIRQAKEYSKMLNFTHPRIAVAGLNPHAGKAVNLNEFDIVVVMYHYQGHIPIKLLGFDSGVNVTVGLPFIRTSVDHGTAFPIAGKGIADSRSMTASLYLAAKMANVKYAK